MPVCVQIFDLRRRSYRSSLNPLQSPQSRERLHNLPRPLRHLILAQRPIRRLKPNPQQNRVFSRSNRSTAENLHRTKLPQLANVRLSHGLSPLDKRNIVGKHKREMPLHRRIFPQRRKAHCPQPAPIQLLQIELRHENILPQLPCRRHIRMNLPKLRHDRAIHSRPRRPSRMKIFRGMPVITHVASKRRQQATRREPPPPSLRGMRASVPRECHPTNRKRCPSQTASPRPRRDSNSTPAYQAYPAPAMSASLTLPRSADSLVPAPGPNSTLRLKKSSALLLKPSSPRHLKSILGGAALSALRYRRQPPSRLQPPRFHSPPRRTTQTSPHRRAK